MANQKIDTIKWFADQIKQTPNAHIWLAAGGLVITGKPIDATEYYQAIMGKPDVSASSESENLLALKNVDVRQGNAHHFQNVALVDLEMVVSWGAYNPSKSFATQSPA